MAPGNIIQPVIEMCQRLSLNEMTEIGKQEGPAISHDPKFVLLTLEARFFHTQKNPMTRDPVKN